MDQLSFPGYTKLEVIGRGGSATVYSAVQTQLERKVAIKVLRSASLDEHSRRLFDAERKALGRLSDHANIVSVFDSGFTPSDEPFLVMQLCAGGSIANLVRQSGPLSIEQATRVGIKIAQALEFAHGLGTLHRDVKPENILISDLGEPLLSDFGIAAVLENGGATSDGAMSLHYVAPEEFIGGRQSMATDLYSLGATLFFLLTGRAPHQIQPAEKLPQNELFSRVSDLQYLVELPRSVDAPPLSRRAIQAILVKDHRRRIQETSMAVALFQNAEAELHTAGRKVVLTTSKQPLKPTADWKTDLSDSDFERTIARSGADWEPPDYVNSVLLTSERTINEHSIIWSSPGSKGGDRGVRNTADSLRDFGSFSDSARVQRATGQPISNAGNDLTVVARRSTNVVTNDTTSSDTSKSQIARASKRSMKLLLVAITLLLAGIAGISFFVRRGAETPRNSEDTGPGASFRPSGISVPIGVLLRPIGLNAVEVSWTNDPDPGVQYQVDMSYGTDIVDNETVAQSPVTFEGLDLAEKLPCFAVSAVETSTNYLASANPICVDRGKTNVPESSSSTSTS